MRESGQAGKITFIDYERSFGFIKSLDGSLESECYFHKNAIQQSCNFDQIQKGDAVEFFPILSDKPTQRVKFMAKVVRLRQPNILPLLGAYSRKGRGHELNEDEFFISELFDGKRIVGAVADGLSNPQDTGWWSSSEVMTYFVSELNKCSLVKDSEPLKIKQKYHAQQAKSLLNNIQDQFKRRQKEMTDSRRQAKSTLTFFVSESDHFICGSAGDSYLLKADITGKKTSYQVGSSEERRKSIVQSAVGERDPSWHPQVISGELRSNELLILCTDGIIIESLSRFITSTISNQKIAEALVDYSITESGRDDATCILLSWSSRLGK